MLIVLSVSIIIMVPPTLSFNTGAPQAACQTLAPDATQHGAPPQTADIPYILDLSTFYDQATDRMVYTADTVYNGIRFTQESVGKVICAISLRINQVELVYCEGIIIVVPIW
jgi:hypothetical protein